jgi:hypothetical protein
MTNLSSLLPQLAINSDTSNHGRNVFLDQFDARLETERKILVSKNIAAAYDRGLSEGFEAAKTEHLAVIDQLRSDFELQLTRAKENWDRDQGSRFAESIELAIDKITTDLSQLLYKAVVPFVKRSISSKALAEIEELLISLLGDNQALELRISGPDALVNFLKSRLSDRNFKVTVTNRDSPEVQIYSDGFLITTRIVEWLAGIDELNLE